MSKTVNPLKLVLEDILVPTGFSPMGGSWFRRSEDVVEIVNLQKSQYGEQYYLNYAIWIRALGGKTPSREEEGHVRMRAGAIVSSEARLAHLLDLDSGGHDDERRSELAALLSSEFLPFTGACRTMKGLRSLLEAGKLKKAMIHATAKLLLMSSST